MSKQRMIHRDLVLERKFTRYFCRAMEHDTWLLRNIWRSGMYLKPKRWL